MKKKHPKIPVYHTVQNKLDKSSTVYQKLFLPDLHTSLEKEDCQKQMKIFLVRGLRLITVVNTEVIDFSCCIV